MKKINSNTKLFIWNLLIHKFSNSLIPLVPFPLSLSPNQHISTLAH